MFRGVWFDQRCVNMPYPTLLLGWDKYLPLSATSNTMTEWVWRAMVTTRDAELGHELNRECE